MAADFSYYNALVFLGKFWTIHSVPTVNYVTTSTIVSFNLKVTKTYYICNVIMVTTATI